MAASVRSAIDGARLQAFVGRMPGDLGALIDPSIYAPRPGCDPPEPAWKDFDNFKDCIHPRQPTFKG